MKNKRMWWLLEMMRQNVVNLPAGFCRDKRQMVDRISWDLSANRHI